MQLDLTRIREAETPFARTFEPADIAVADDPFRVTSPVELVMTIRKDDDLFRLYVRPSFEAYVGHKEACAMLPPGALLLATSTTCPVQMFRLGRNQYVTQFHPEMDRQALVTRIQVYRHSGYFPADEVDAVIDRVSRADVAASHEVLRAFVRRYAGGGGSRPVVTSGALAAR